MGKANSFLCQDLIPNHFGHAPRLHSMIKFAPLARELVGFIKNGVMSHVACTKAIKELYLVKPGLVQKVRDPVTLALEISRAIRTLLCWYREYCKGKATSILKKATKGDEAALIRYKFWPPPFATS